MFQHLGLHNGNKLLLVLTITCLVLTAVVPIQAGRPGNQFQRRAADRPYPTTSANAAGTADKYSEYAIGVYLMETGFILQAVNHLENAWRLSDREIPVGLKLANAYFMLRNFSRCEIVIDDVLAQNADNFDAMLLKAKVRYIKRDNNNAVGILENIREIHGLNFGIERFLGNIAYEAGDVEKSLEAYANCIKKDDAYSYIQYRYGMLMLHKLEISAAESAFCRALELDPGFAEPTLELAEIYVNTGRIAETVGVLETAVHANPANNEVLTALSEVYLKTGRLDDGIRLLEERKSNATLSRDAEILLGRLYYENRNFTEAHDIFRLLLDSDKTNPELARILGEITLRMGEPDRSLDYFDSAIAMDPSDYRSYMGKFFAASPGLSNDTTVIDLSHEEKAELLERAAPLVEKHDFEGNYLLGICYLTLDSLAPAKNYLLQANNIVADDAGTLLNLANVCEKLKEFGNAEMYLARLYELNPDDATICNFYGYLLAEMRKDLDMAEKLILKALQIDPENGYYLDSLGWVYYQMGEYKKAVVEIEKASLLVPGDSVILEHLGDAYRALKRFNEARAAYKESSRLQDGNTGIIEKIESTENLPD